MTSITDLRLRRIRRGIKSYELARTLGVHPSKLCRWEKGTAKPDADELARWKAALPAKRNT